MVLVRGILRIILKDFINFKLSQINIIVVKGTQPNQVSHVPGTALTEKVGRVSRPLVGMERIMGRE